MMKEPIKKAINGETEQQKMVVVLAHFDLFFFGLERHLRVKLTPKITGRTAELCRCWSHNHKTGINTKWGALSE